MDAIRAASAVLDSDRPVARLSCPGLAPVLLPFVLGLTLAYFFNPIVDLLGRIGLPRWASALLLLAISTCLIVIALIFVVPILLQQAAGLIEAPPRKIGRLRAFIDESAREHFGGRYPQAGATIRTALDAFSGAIPSLLAEVAASLWNKGFAAIKLHFHSSRDADCIFLRAYRLAENGRQARLLSATRQCRPDT